MFTFVYITKISIFTHPIIINSKTDSLILESSPSFRTFLGQSTPVPEEWSFRNPEKRDIDFSLPASSIRSDSIRSLSFPPPSSPLPSDQNFGLKRYSSRQWPATSFRFLRYNNQKKRKRKRINNIKKKKKHSLSPVLSNLCSWTWFLFREEWKGEVGGRKNVFFFFISQFLFVFCLDRYGCSLLLSEDILTVSR